MTRAFRPRTVVLFVGDLIFFGLGLWLSLFFRSFDIPSSDLFEAHLVPFSILFFVWIFVFFIAGLYESRSILLARRSLSATLLVAQTINIIFAALFFFIVPFFGIAPKVLLIIYLIVSFSLEFFWRVVLFPLLGLQKTENAVMVGKGSEVDELVSALDLAERAPARVAVSIDPASPTLPQEVERAVNESRARFIIADFNDARVASAFPALYNFISSGIRFFDATVLYEEVFGRIPLSALDDRWLARNVSKYAYTLYDASKRSMDILVAVVGGIVSLPFYPLIALAIWLDDHGPVIIALPRVGEGGKPFSLYKFRSMSGNDKGDYGPAGATKLTVTRVGKILRKTRLDELPQFWNIFRGDLSFIGPRPEAPALVAHYEREIPYYGVRHLIKPGLSGWAQLYQYTDPHHATDVEATRRKLSYDLYYLKHRSLLLDVIIALKTVRRLVVKSNA